MGQTLVFTRHGTRRPCLLPTLHMQFDPSPQEAVEAPVTTILDLHKVPCQSSSPSTLTAPPTRTTSPSTAAAHQTPSHARARACYPYPPRQVSTVASLRRVRLCPSVTRLDPLRKTSNLLCLHSPAARASTVAHPRQSASDRTDSHTRPARSLHASQPARTHARTGERASESRAGQRDPHLPPLRCAPRRRRGGGEGANERGGRVELSLRHARAHAGELATRDGAQAGGRGRALSWGVGSWEAGSSWPARSTPRRGTTTRRKGWVGHCVRAGGLGEALAVRRRRRRRRRAG